MTADETRQNQGEAVIEWTGIQHLARFCEHVPLLGALASQVEKFPEGWRKFVWSVVGGVLISAILAIPGFMWAQYKMISDSQKQMAVTRERVQYLQGRVDKLSQGQDEQTDLLRDLRMQIMRMQETERLRNE